MKRYTWNGRNDGSKIRISKDIEKNQNDHSPEIVFAYYILYVYAHAFHMRQLNVLNDNEWMGWLQWMRTSFEQGAILDYWKERQHHPKKTV